MAYRSLSNRTVISTTTNGVTDASGNSVISADNSFGGSPLGVAALGQTLFGVPNPTFNIIPQDISSNIDNNTNPLPYWSITENTSDSMAAKIVYDSATNTYSLRLTPGSALSGEYMSVTTRIPVISDDNLGLRQRVVSTLAKVGTYSGSTQFNVSITASYYDHLDVLLSTYTVGSVLDNATISSIVGYTTTGSSTVSAAASYVDLAIVMTATANVTSGISVDVDSILLQSSLAGGGSLLVTETFNSSGTWTRPTGVDYVTVVAVGAGQGGQGGGLWSDRAVVPAIFDANGGVGGATGYWAIVRDIYVGNVSTVSVGIGAGGSGGTALTFTKTAGASTRVQTLNGSSGSNGGDTTFGTFLTVPGARTAPTAYFGADSSAGASGGAQGNPTGTVNGGTGATNAIGSTFVGAPYTVLTTSGSAGTAGSGGTINGTGGAASATAGIAGGGGGGGGARAVQGTGTRLAGNGGASAPCGGGGGGASSLNAAFATTFGGTAGSGGAAGANTGGGGGGGAALALAVGNTTLGTATTEYNNSTINIASGKGGDGGSGFVKVIYVA